MLAWSGFGARSKPEVPSTTAAEEGATQRSSSQPLPRFGSNPGQIQPMVAEYAFKTQWWKRLVIRYLDLDKAKARGEKAGGATLDAISRWSSRALPPYSQSVDSLGLMASFMQGLLTQVDTLSDRVRVLEERERFYQDEVMVLKSDLALSQLAIAEMQKAKPMKSWILDDGYDELQAEARAAVGYFDPQAMLEEKARRDAESASGSAKSSGVDDKFIKIDPKTYDIGDSQEQVSEGLSTHKSEWLPGTGGVPTLGSVSPSPRVLSPANSVAHLTPPSDVKPPWWPEVSQTQLTPSTTKAEEAATDENLPGTSTCLRNIQEVAAKALEAAELAHLRPAESAPPSKGESTDMGVSTVGSFPTQVVAPPTQVVPPPSTPVPTVPADVPGDRYSAEELGKRLFMQNSTDGRACQRCMRFKKRCECKEGPLTIEEVRQQTIAMQKAAWKREQEQSAPQPTPTAGEAVQSVTRGNSQPPGPLAPAQVTPAVEPRSREAWPAWEAVSLMDDRQLATPTGPPMTLAPGQVSLPVKAPPSIGQRSPQQPPPQQTQQQQQQLPVKPPPPAWMLAKGGKPPPPSTPPPPELAAKAKPQQPQPPPVSRARSTPRVSSSANSSEMPAHPARGTIWASQFAFNGGVECPHTENGGCQPYKNQHGSGWRCEDCHTKWFRRNNGEEVVTSGPTRFRRPGFRVGMPHTVAA